MSVETFHPYRELPEAWSLYSPMLPRPVYRLNMPEAVDRQAFIDAVEKMAELYRATAELLDQVVDDLLRQQAEPRHVSPERHALQALKNFEEFRVWAQLLHNGGDALDARFTEATGIRLQVDTRPPGSHGEAP